MDMVHFHLIVLHFPIALLIVGALLEVVSIVMGLPTARSAARLFLMLGALGALATAWSGDAAEGLVERSRRVSEDVLERHEELGMWTAYVAAALLVAQLASLRFRGPVLRWGVAALAVVAAVMVGLAGFTGGKIRHDASPEGGPPAAGASAPFVPIPEPDVRTGE
jgi:uncharacterized membrane protein